LKPLARTALAALVCLPLLAPALSMAGGAVTTGKASWYGPGFNGKRAASGEIFDENALTAAHRTLPFGTRLLVTNPANGKSVVVRVNDRGPFHRNRVLDLSKAAAQQIGIVRAGVGTVTMQPM